MYDDVPLVGRDRELGLLRDVLDEVRRGRGQVVSISGEPGVGKTAVARALSAAATADGAHVLWGGFFEGESQPSFGPWLTALAALGVTPAAGADGLQPPEARLQLFTSVHEALVTAATDTPVVVILDDLHWAGRDSIELFAFVAERAARSRILVVGTYRDPDPAVAAATPLAGVLGALVRLGNHHQLQLGGLDPAAVDGYLIQKLGNPVPGAVVRAVHEQTAGNPFFVSEVAQLLAEEGKLVKRDGRWTSDFSIAELGIPVTVRHAVRGRVSGLSGTTRKLLQTASAFSGELELEIVRIVAGLGETEALDALDEALDVGLLRRSGHDEAPYVFAHAIVRQAIAESLNPDRAARLHRHAADVLEQLRPTHHAAIAEQYLASRSLPGAEFGVAHCLAAADAAASQHSSQQVARFLELALQLVADGDAETRLDVLQRLAVAQAEAFDDIKAPATTLLAISLSAPSDGARLIVRVVEALQAGAPPSSWRPLVQRGLGLVGDNRDATWARLAVAVDPVETVAAGPLFIGRWRGYPTDAVAVLEATGLDSDAAWAIEPFKPRSEAETWHMLERSRRWSDAAARMRALDVAGRDFSLRHGRTIAAIDCYRELLELGSTLGSIPAQAEASGQLALCLALAGETTAAEQGLARTIELVRDLWVGHRLHLLGTLSSSVIVGFMVGDADWPTLAERLTAWVETPLAAGAPFANVFAALAALCHAFAGDAETARRLSRELTGVLDRMNIHDHAVSGSMWFLATSAWVLGDKELAAGVGPLIERHQAAGGPPGPVPSLDDAAGRIAALLNHPRHGAERLAGAAAQFEAAGCLGVAALARWDEAVVRGDDDLGAQALRTFERLGMRGWAARARGARSAPAAAPSGLTSRELEVLGLLAGGRTSKEIAADLVVSLLTVNRHVANIYTKIGVRNRSEATAFALAHHLVTPSPAQSCPDP